LEEARLAIESTPDRFANAAAVAEAARSSASALPLCVDLDGTLVKSDTLVDTVVVLARQTPMALLSFPGWMAQGKAAFKRRVTSLAELDIERLPYNKPLLEYLREEHARGREIWLATGADTLLAERVAEHLGLFAGVLASDGEVNLTGKNKLAAFEQRFPQGFCYIGNARPDMPLLTACVMPMVANPHRALSAGLRAARIMPARAFADSVSPAKAWMKAIRLHQWAKNTLIFLPLLLAHQRAAGPVVASLMAFFSFGFAASATYIINDLLDLEADRHHARKRRRPFAAGDLSPIAGVLTSLLFFAASLVLAIALPHVLAALSPQTTAQGTAFFEWLALYVVATMAYSLRLKRMVLVDVIVLSSLYTIRLLAGSAAAQVEISPWLAAFSIFFFLSLAFVKRFSELEAMQEATQGRAAVSVKGRGYRVSDLEQVRSFGTASGCASVVVFALYIGLNEAARQLYPHYGRLWLLVPVLLLWLFRLWLLASRGDLHEDPVVYAITDKRSLMLGALVVGIVVSAAL
jgi:4-hydroxybenzoate polyprenyltransferase/phosphoserine phosphatase